MTQSQLNYFNSMQPGQSISTSQVTNPTDLIKAGKEYIDQGGAMYFNDDYTIATKQYPIPYALQIKIFCDY
jgi:hypothetical protein